MTTYEYLMSLLTPPAVTPNKNTEDRRTGQKQISEPQYRYLSDWITGMKPTKSINPTSLPVRGDKQNNSRITVPTPANGIRTARLGVNDEETPRQLNLNELKNPQGKRNAAIQSLSTQIQNNWDKPESIDSDFGNVVELDDAEPNFQFTTDIASNGKNGYTVREGKSGEFNNLVNHNSASDYENGFDLIKYANNDRLGEGFWSLKSDTAGRTLLAWYLFGNGADFIASDGYYGEYLKNNKGDPKNGVKSLKDQVKDIVFIEGNDLEPGEQKAIDITTPMVIENGEDIIGYQYLHGTNADVGGFQIKGTISKNDN